MANTSKDASEGLKAGVRSSEFYLSLCAVLLGIAVSTGLVDVDAGTGVWDKVAGIACTLLAAFGYTVSRGKVKAAAEKNK